MKNRLTSLHKLNVILIAIFALLISAHSPVFAQDETKSRSIDAEDFLKQRPVDGIGTPAKTGGGKGKGTKPPAKPTQRPKYDFVRKEQKVARVKNNGSRPIAKTPPKSALATKTTEIGVTIWRLRPARSGEAGPHFQVQLPNGKRVPWTPERVGANTVFTKGDKVRLAVESSIEGFLYVVDSEILSNGGFGDPHLIFPASANDNNRVRPGLLVDIPDQSEDLPYFLINPNDEDYAGELLTVIVSPQPLENLETDPKGRILNAEKLAELEENTEVEMYSKAGNPGET